MLQNIEIGKVSDIIYILDRTILLIDDYTENGVVGKEGEHDSLLGNRCVQKLEQADCFMVHCALHAPVQRRFDCRDQCLSG